MQSSQNLLQVIRLHSNANIYIYMYTHHKHYLSPALGLLIQPHHICHTSTYIHHICPHTHITHPHTHITYAHIHTSHIHIHTSHMPTYTHHTSTYTHHTYPPTPTSLPRYIDNSILFNDELRRRSMLHKLIVGSSTTLSNTVTVAIC